MSGTDSTPPQGFLHHIVTVALTDEPDGMHIVKCHTEQAGMGIECNPFVAEKSVPAYRSTKGLREFP